MPASQGAIDTLLTLSELSQWWKRNIKPPPVIHIVPTPPWHNHMSPPATEDVVVVLDVVLVVVAVLVVEAGAVQPQTVITGGGIVAVDGITNTTALMMLTVCSEEEEAAAAAAVSCCTFNRGYDCVITLAQQGNISLSPNLILFDSCSMCSVCNDSSLLHDVQHFKEHGLAQGLRIVSNGGTMDCNQVGSIGTL